MFDIGFPLFLGDKCGKATPAETDLTYAATLTELIMLDSSADSGRDLVMRESLVA
jgi:hypothetical protein